MDAEVVREAPESRWDGRTGHVGYVAKMFPRISETFILNEVLALRRHGIPLRLYSLMPPTRDARTHPEAQALLPEVTVLPQPGWPALWGFLGDLGFCLKGAPGATLRELLRFLCRPVRRRYRRLFRAVSLGARLRRDRVAHLHAAWAHTPASVARIAARLTGIPWSMAGHAKDIHLSRPSSLAKKLGSARFTLACTEAHRALLQEIGAPEEHDLPRPSILLNYHGVDLDYFSPAEDSPAEETPTPLIVSVGRLIPKKGFDLLIGAAAALRDRGVAFRMEIIGEGRLRQALRERIRFFGLQRSVTLRGMLVKNEVREAYRRAACVVLASRIAPNGDRDGIPNTLAEAMACGLPVVATRLPSIEELVQDGETGLLVPPENMRALADALETVLRDRGVRRRLGEQARRHVSEMFRAESWTARVAERLETSRGIEKVLYLSADRGVPVQGSKGASVHVRSVVKALGQLGVRSLVLTTRRGPEEGPAAAAPLVETGARGRWKTLAARLSGWVRGGPVLERELLRLFDNVFMYREARRQARAWHPDLVYERYSLTAVAGALVARRLSLPFFLEVNAPLADEETRFRGLRLARLTHGLERWVFRRADRVIVVSQPLAQHARALGVRPERIVVLPNAVDPELFHPARDG